MLNIIKHLHFIIHCLESELHTWYKTVRTQFGKLSKRKSGDGSRELSDRDRWVLTSFDFLKTHIVRVTSRQAGGVSIAPLFFVFTSFYM